MIEARIGRFKPNTWQRMTNNENDKVDVMYTCPNGHNAFLDHEISDDGTVSPSVVCSECDFHDYIKLVGWEV